MHITQQEYKDIVWNLALKCTKCYVGKFCSEYTFADGSYAVVGDIDIVFYSKQAKRFSVFTK